MPVSNKSIFLNSLTLPNNMTHTFNQNTVLVTSRASIKQPFSSKTEDKDNITAVNWHMPCSTTHYAISIKKSSLTHQLINKSHVFAVNFNISKELAEQCGTTSGKTINKFKEFNIETEESEKIDCPRLKSYIECQVINRIDLNNYEVFIGKILKNNQ
jgi:flavin reductase (DIM6/NTAB) family NADH-FMN oxidoreductase RutF